MRGLQNLNNFIAFIIALNCCLAFSGCRTSGEKRQAAKKQFEIRLARAVEKSQAAIYRFDFDKAASGLYELQDEAAKYPDIYDRLDDAIDFVNVARTNWQLGKMKGRVPFEGQMIEPSEMAALPSDELTLDLGSGERMKMVKIPAGEYWMGSSEDEEGRGDSEAPRHRVRIGKAFYIGKYEVTQGQWGAVMGSNPSAFSSGGSESDKVRGMDTSRFPVDSVSWEDCQEFCRKLSQRVGREIRLPSESEWEYACRSGTSGPFYTGGTISPSQANYDSYFTYRNGSKGAVLARPARVGSYGANEFGLSDMHGNLYEWCADVWHGNYVGAPSDGGAWTWGGNQDRRVLRGGFWAGLPGDCRSANRFDDTPGSRNNYFYGFRVAS